MQYFVKLPLALLVIVMSFSVRASQPMLQRFLSEVDSMSAHFEQTVTDETGSVLSRSKGMFYLQRPSQFRWDYRNENEQDEVGQQIIANNGDLFVYDPELEQMIQSSLRNAVEQVPSLVLLQKNSDIEAVFKVKDLGVVDGKSWVALRPREEQASYSQLLLGFVKGELRQIDLIDALGNETKLQFYVLKVNESLPKNIFRFVPPEGTDRFKQ